MSRADVDTSVSSSSASWYPSSAAAASWSSRASRSRPRPVTTWTASRTSRSFSYAASTAPWGRSASQAAARARRTVMSRRPPRASLRSGSRRCARSPWRECRWAICSWSCGSRVRALARQSWATVDFAALTTSSSPATKVMSRRPTAADRSAPATVRHWLTVRTLWSSFTPWSQIGYQSRSASAVRSAAPRARVWWSRTRSKSLRGPPSRRARLPTAASATPERRRPVEASAQRSASHCIPKSARAARRPGPAPGAEKLRVPARSRRRVVTSVGVVTATVPLRFGVVGGSSEGVVAALAGADPDHVVDRDGPDLPVADPAGLGRLEDDVDDAAGVEVVDEHLDPHLRDEIHGVLRAAVDLAVSPLPAVPAGLADGHAGDAVGLEGLLHLVELVRLDDRRDELHADAPSLVAASESTDSSGAVRAAMTLRALPPPKLVSSYAVSACSRRSIPSTSSSGLIVKPIVRSRTKPMMAVMTNE